MGLCVVINQNGDVSGEEYREAKNLTYKNDSRGHFIHHRAELNDRKLFISLPDLLR